MGTFYKSVKKSSPKECFTFLLEHFQYDTMNSWNCLKSYANNVKLNTLKYKGLKYNWCKVYDALENGGGYFQINDAIQQYNDESNLNVYFNGRSGGYLVIGNKQNNCGIIPDYVKECDTYEDLKKWVKEYSGYSTMEEFRKGELVSMVETLQSFDKLCDELVELCNLVTENYIEEQRTQVRYMVTLFKDGEKRTELNEFETLEKAISYSCTCTNILLTREEVNKGYFYRIFKNTYYDNVLTKTVKIADVYDEER